MRLATAFVICSLLVAPALADLVSVERYTDWADVQARISGGFDFVGRGDTVSVQTTRANPVGQTTTPYNLWQSGILRGFNVTYNLGAAADTVIDDVHAIVEPVSIDPATNGVLITTRALGAGRSALLNNLSILVWDDANPPNYEFVPVPMDAVAPWNSSDISYLLIETNLDLHHGFLVSGGATFTWGGSLAPPDEHWFEIAPVVIIPEPAANVLLVLGPFLTGFLRRR